MSIAYDSYLKSHRQCVQYGIQWVLSKFSEDELHTLFPKTRIKDLLLIGRCHDLSKDSPEEYEAYDDYFYADQRTDEIEERFSYAWLHHMHHNPHHWQYWILKDDDSDQTSFKALAMPDEYIVEMLADWWSFSWKEYILRHDRNDLYGIFNWYDDHKDRMMLHTKTKDTVEKFLDLLRDKLDSSDSLIELMVIDKTDF